MISFYFNLFHFFVFKPHYRTFPMLVRGLKIQRILYYHYCKRLIINLYSITRSIQFRNVHQSLCLIDTYNHSQHPIVYLQSIYSPKILKQCSRERRFIMTIVIILPWEFFVVLSDLVLSSDWTWSLKLFSLRKKWFYEYFLIIATDFIINVTI